ncbi:MAG TPA: ester cyclase [Actinomycetota bacterium]|jgi:steroid delta-isomerase-like uncharacterized protein
MGEAQSTVQHFYDAFNSGELDSARDVVADDFENTDPTGTLRGWDAFREYISVFKSAMPDATLNPKRFVESGNTVVTEGTFTGTFTNPMPSPQGEVPPTGKPFELPFMEINDVENGRVKSHRVYYDQMAFMAALGLGQQQ